MPAQQFRFNDEGSGAPAEPLLLSSSVEYVSGQIADQKGEGAPISELFFVQKLLELHPEYAERKGERIRLTEKHSLPKGSVRGWLEQVRPLFRQEAVDRLHGRLVIFGLSLLSRELTRQLARDTFLQSLETEIESQYGDIERLLSRLGLEARQKQRQWLQAFPDGAVPTHVDSPTGFDELGRKAFADALAARLKYIRFEARQSKASAFSQESASFMLHLHGPWGSGKSSLLNFLRNELQAGDKNAPPEAKDAYWIVVDFNAWQHRRTSPPWWWLMNAVFQQSVHQLWKFQKRRAIALWLKEHWWRIRSAGWLPYLLAACLLYWAFTRLGVSLRADVKPFADVLAFATTLWGLFLATSRSLLPGTARGAQGFLEMSRNPTRFLSDHFCQLIKWIDYPVVVMIDDLDRCRGEYVVELLEGIQTLFRNAPITYVVASDRRWLCACYENAYDQFSSALQEPGRPMSHLFMDKIFQLSASVPYMSLQTKQDYWNRLIESAQKGNPNDLEQARREARERLAENNSVEEIIALVQNEQDPLTRQIAREEAIKLLATPGAQKQTEHMLKPFAPLLEPNPRAMKRLVNAYSVQRDISLLSGADIDLKILALWTILSLRWPLLSEYLAERATLARDGENLLPADMPEPMLQLLKSNEVQSVIQGNGIGAELDESAIRECACLGFPETTQTPPA